MVSRTVKTSSDLPGKVSSLSVAILVDLSPPPKPEGEDAEAPKATTLATKDIEEMARSALGLSEPDSLSVKETTFAASLASKIEVPETGGGFTDPQFLLEMGRRFSLGILVIGALLALRMFRGPKRKGAELPAGEQHPQLAGQGVGADHLLGVGEASPEVLRAQITNALQNNPEEVKKLFLHWVESKQEGA